MSLDIDELRRTKSLVSFLPAELRIEQVQVGKRNTRTRRGRAVATPLTSEASNLPNTSASSDQKPGRRRERRVKQAAATATNELARYRLRKELNKNVFLSMILKSQHELWRSELQTALKKEKIHLEYDSAALVLTPNGKSSGEQIEPIKDWFAKVNRVLSEFFSRFRMEKINFDWSNVVQINQLKERIGENQRIEYVEEGETLYVFGRLDHFAEFLARNPQVAPFFVRNPISASLAGARSAVESGPRRVSAAAAAAAPQPTKLANKPIASRHVRLQSSLYNSYSSLIQKLVEYLKIKFELTSCFIDVTANDIDFTGLEANASKASTVLTQCLTRIRTKNVANLNLNILKAKQLDSIVKDCLKNVELVFDVKVNLNEKKEFTSRV